jgi:Transposase DDE domain group 1
MTNCTKELFKYPAFDRRKIEASFGGGDVSSDAGIMLLSQVDNKLGLTKALDSAIQDPRNAHLITHEQKDLIKQRIFGLALGYEDLNERWTPKFGPVVKL